MPQTNPRTTVSILTDDAAVTKYFQPLSVIAQVQTESRVDQEKFPTFGLGAHENRRLAEQIARAEAAERWAIANVSPSRVRFGCLAEKKNRIDPRTIQAISASQAQRLHLQPFDENRNYYWIAGREVASMRRVEMIADMCCAFQDIDYPHVAWVNSSGVAAHRSKALAEQSALLELYERDALMITWMAHRSPPRISPHRLSEKGFAYVDNIRQAGYDCVCLDMSCRQVPVSAAVAYHHLQPALIFTIAARPTLKQAAEAAWKEAEVEIFWRIREQLAGNTQVVTMDEVADVSHHTWFYNQVENLPHASFLWQSQQETVRALDEPAFANGETFDLAACQAALGLDTLYRLNYADVFGLKVLRLISPNLVPLLFGYDQFPLTHPARRTATLCGSTGSPWPSTEIPPHPLA